MRKSKKNLYNDQPPRTLVPFLLGAGMLLLCLVSCAGVMKWSWHLADQDYARTSTAISVQRKNSTKVPLTAPLKPVSFSGPLKGSLIYTAPDGFLYHYSAPYTLDKPNIKAVAGFNGHSLSVFGQRLVGFCAKDEVCVRLDSDAPSRTLNVRGFSPAWGADGEHVYYYVRTENRYFLERIHIHTGQSFRMLSVYYYPNAPVFDPASGRTLIAEWEPNEGTTFFTIPPDCVGDADCRAHKQIMGKTSEAVWNAVYHPSAMYLAFDNGSNALYLMNTSDGTTQFLVNGTRPAFSPDGTQLAFRSESFTIQLLNLSDMSLIDLKVRAESVAWME